MNIVTIISIVFLCVAVLTAIFVALFVWWVEKKKKQGIGFFAAIFGSIYNAIDNFHNIVTGNRVKTVYSNKKRCYSGTENLEVPKKASTEQFDYEFVGWEKCGMDNDGKPVLSPIFLAHVKKLAVNVFDDDKETTELLQGKFWWHKAA